MRAVGIYYKKLQRGGKKITKLKFIYYLNLHNHYPFVTISPQVSITKRVTIGFFVPIFEQVTNPQHVSFGLLVTTYMNDSITLFATITGACFFHFHCYYPST